MYDNFKVANYSKALLSPELFARHLSRLYSGDVVDGLTVAPGTGMQVVLSPGNAFVRYGSADVASARLVSLVAPFNLTIGTADASNPRIDLVVLYVDNGVSLPSGTPTTANLDGKGVPKAKIVPGTPNASPAAPNSTAIQASVGSGNPYTVLYQVRVNAGVTVIAGDKVSDVRSIAKLPSSRLSLPVTTDANGWRVYDYGSFKKWVKTFLPAYVTPGPLGGSTTAGPIGEVSSLPLPVGVPNMAAVTMQHSHTAKQGGNVALIEVTNMPNDLSTLTVLPQFFIHNTYPSTTTFERFLITVELTSL